MSATINPKNFVDFLGPSRTRVVYMQGRRFPIKILTADQPSTDYVSDAASTCVQVGRLDVPFLGTSFHRCTVNQRAHQIAVSSSSWRERRRSPDVSVLSAVSTKLYWNQRNRQAAPLWSITHHCLPDSPSFLSSQVYLRRNSWKPWLSANR